MTLMNLDKTKKSQAFIDKVEELSEQNLFKCFQCGKCSAGCPFADEMDIIPSEIIRRASLGLEEEVLAANSIWLCAACYTCDVRCPKGIDISRIMEALRQIVLRRNENRYDKEELTPECLEGLPPIAMVGALRKLSG